MIYISNEQLIQYRDIIFKESGLWFGDSKLSILANRVRMRMKERDLEDPAAYGRLIASHDDRVELERLLNSVTTNETYFYRCESQIDSFRDIVLPDVARKKIARNDRTLKIWCAGCSTGEEPYTLAMVILESLQFHKIWDISIFATDISTEVLAKGLNAVYAPKAVSRLPREYLSRYFTERNGLFELNPVVKKMVDFEYQNLTDAYFEKGFDIIFCRNVIIYFKDETKQEILNKFYDTLNDDGYLFLGPSEMVRGLAQGFRMITLKDSVVFQKVAR
jgi:chemotaxis protein methyltransferase CheR